MRALDDDVSKQLADAYLKRLKYRDVPHPRVMLIFSGMPGCGKTTLARRLARDLKAQYVHSDTIRNMMRELGIDPVGIQVPPISQRIAEHILAHDKNQFIIFDASADRSWQAFLAHCQKVQARPIIIRLDVPPAIIAERIKARDRTDGERLLAALPRYQADFEHACAAVPADLTLGEHYNYAEVLARLRLCAQLA